MKYLVYKRVSTDSQNFLQQENTIRKWFEAHRETDGAEVVEISEKCSGDVDISGREVSRLLEMSEAGDMVVVSEMSRMHRTMVELVGLCKELFKRGVGIIEAKSGQVFEGDPSNFVNQILLFAMGLAAEMELNSNRDRRASGIEVMKRNIREHGYHISRRGNVVTRLGSDNMKVVQAEGTVAAARKKREALENDEGRRRALAYARQLREAYKSDGGRYTLMEIADQLNTVGLFTANITRWTAQNVSRLLR